MDETWMELREPWERLIWARRLRFETAKAAAESMGMNADTYRAYERRPDSSKHTRLDHQSAARFAQKFRVRWEWLLVGEGDPVASLDNPDGPPTPTERVVDLMRRLPRGRQEEVATAFEALIKAGRRE